MVPVSTTCMFTLHGKGMSRAIRWCAGTSRLLQRFLNALLCPRFFRQSKSPQKIYERPSNLSNVKLIGIGVDFAKFHEIRQKLPYSLSSWPPHKCQHQATLNRNIFSHLYQPPVQFSPSIRRVRFGVRPIGTFDGEGGQRRDRRNGRQNVYQLRRGTWREDEHPQTSESGERW